MLFRNPNPKIQGGSGCGSVLKVRDLNDLKDPAAENGPLGPEGGGRAAAGPSGCRTSFSRIVLFRGRDRRARQAQGGRRSPRSLMACAAELEAELHKHNIFCRDHVFRVEAKNRARNGGVNGPGPFGAQSRFLTTSIRKSYSAYISKMFAVTRRWEVVMSAP